MSEGVSERLLRALDFAVREHGRVRQARKGTPFPYVIHPMRVAETLSKYDCDEDLVIAGLLHDTVEDAGVTTQQIEAEFGPDVARLVEGASEPDRSASWEERKQHTVDYLRDEAPRDVALVAAADKLDNLRSIRADLEHRGEGLWKIFNRPRDKQRWYYRSLADAFLARDHEHPLFRAVAREVDEVFP